MTVREKIESLFADFQKENGHSANTVLINEYYLKEIIKEQGLKYSDFDNRKDNEILGREVIITECYSIAVTRRDETKEIEND